MKQFFRWILLTGLCVLTAFGTLACGGENGEPAKIDRTDVEKPDEETIAYQGGSNDGNSELPLPTPTDEPTPRPTPDPEATPQPTRPPMEGDVATDRFPSYDTGWDADWSYQSDELRIAVKRVENEEDRIVYYVADIWMRNINCFRTEFAGGRHQAPREDPEDFANRVNAIFGISGTMNSGLIVHNGTKYQNAEDPDIPFRTGVVAIYRDGSVKMFRLKKQTFNYKKESEKNGGLLHALQFGPILVQDGEIPSGLKQKERHPRIIFGYCEPGHYIAVAVDGRTKTSIGMTEQEMAELMLSLGCTDAINLDGGNSAVMLFMGKTINVPSGKDKDGDGIAGRNILDLLAFAEYDETGNAPALSSVHPDHVRGE